MVNNFSRALGKAAPELLERPVAMAAEAGIFSLTVAVNGFFIFSSVPFPLHCSQGLLSGIMVDDNLASVFIFLSSADNEHGTKAIEKLWKDEHRHTEKKNTLLQRESGPFSAVTTVSRGQTFQDKVESTKRPCYFKHKLFFITLNSSQVGLSEPLVVYAMLSALLW